MKRQYSSSEIVQAMITVTVLEDGPTFWRANDVLVWAEDNLHQNEMHRLNKEAIRVGAS